jgi:hypothetical protein
MQLDVTRETAKTIVPLLPATDSVEANEGELVARAKAGFAAT